MATNRFNESHKNDLVIFYADDDIDDLDTFKDALDDIGRDTTVYVHDRGDKLLTALKNPPPNPHFVFLDLNMPGKNGFEVLKEIKESEMLKDTPVIILSTSSDNTTIKETQRLGADYYITKPNSFANLKKSIATVLDINWAEHSSLSNFVFQNHN